MIALDGSDHAEVIAFGLYEFPEASEGDSFTIHGFEGQALAFSGVIPLQGTDPARPDPKIARGLRWVLSDHGSGGGVLEANTIYLAVHSSAAGAGGELLPFSWVADAVLELAQGKADVIGYLVGPGTTAPYPQANGDFAFPTSRVRAAIWT
ncbi:hypothetical protein SPF06_18510 [Sinomonas sp. JGH33]|uniref:Uncharacterized protein n=1 Tax=Sinomonas terricola TaxID=3110330 RepID=A0ABU5TAK3_9MICC|nr:hypothetical protein [Sinomonas sp. JGH33]MEA5456720.1 hypothetical protein [Sinomonas sp. JGH33]